LRSAPSFILSGAPFPTISEQNGALKRSLRKLFVDEIENLSPREGASPFYG
jgi:hypothetical protein